ncbi:PKD domain-containing protein [Halorussus caseinilyticus]|uniref:PKD domain-containing protein n=1 Tax=Halorussus caseinilyticus TaxID=3034025 RepID=A0ABD5WL15_9EURY|nr:PKD domain-containing protein [Halorussus sp. DT72]
MGLTTGAVVGGAAAAGNAPTATFDYSPSDPVPDETVTFDASSSTDDGTIEEYEWDLDGDGYFGYDGSTVTRSFDTAGEYVVTLRVTDDEGNSVTTTKTVSVTNDAPTAAFDYSPSDPVPDETVTFDASSSTDSDGSIEEYEWDLDGDGYFGYDGSTVTRSFDTAGSYTVTLRVTDNGDVTTKETKTVRVGNDAPNATFTYSPSDPAPDDTITFDAGASSDADGNIEEYEWDFDGDGYFGYDGSQNTYSFDTAGSYTVTLRVTDNGDVTTKETKTIRVGNDAPNATFTYSPSNPSPDDTITFDAGASSDADGQITEYEWDFDGDGYFGYDGSQNTYSFDTAGTYPVTLRVTDNGEQTVKEIRTIRVENSAPEPSFTFSPTNPAPDQTVTFDAGASSDADGRITEYEWDFDGDGYFGYDGSQTTYTFDESGVQTVTLRVTDNGERTVKKTLRVPVGDVATTTPESLALEETTETTERTEAPETEETPESTEDTASSGVDGQSFANGELFQVARLYTPEKIIAPGSPGRLAGAFTADVTNEKPVKVQITLQVPSGIQIQGGSDVQSSGGGLPTATFVIAPGETKDISAEVVGSDPGTYTLRAAITYFPVGNTSAAKEYDGLELNFEVRDDETTESASDEGTETVTETAPTGDTPGFSVGVTVVALLAAAMLARRAGE